VREVEIDLGGQLVILVDMAGLRDTESKAEAEGVRRARAQIDQADLVLWLDAADGRRALPDIKTAAPVWTIGTKSDLTASTGSAPFNISVKTGDGLPELLARLTEFADGANGHGEPALLDRERDREAVAGAIAALREARASLGEMELAAEALRRAGDALARLLGRMDTEMVLDRLFAAFCIGK